MALNKGLLEGAILASLKAGQGAGGSAEKMASELATAIDVYVRGIEIESSVTTQVQVSTLTGTGGGTGRAKSTIVN